MKIVIIGAGISGCAAYLLLKKHLPKPGPGEDDSITIYEAYDTDKDTTHAERGEESTHSSTLIVGGGLGVGANGLNVLRRLDENLLRNIVRGGYVVATSNMKSKNGTVLVRMRTDNAPSSTDNNQHNLNMLATSRHSIWRCMRVQIPDGDIVTKRVAEVVAKPDGRNLVRFADGSPPVEADLIIGADGLKSTAKRALFSEAKEDPYPPQYEGLVGVGGFIPAKEVRPYVEDGSMNFVFGGNGFFGYFFSESSASSPNRDSTDHVSEPGDNLAWWSTYAIDECPTPRSLDMDAVTRQLRERHSNWRDPVIQSVLKTLRVEHLYPTWTVPPLPTWERDGVVLVGDAAHALPSTSGQGSSQALEDVEAFTLFLSHYLRKASGDKTSDAMSRKRVISQAAKQYQSLRMPHVTEILHEAQRIQGAKRDKGYIEEHIMYSFLWIMGHFPSVMTKKSAGVFGYNVAQEVAKIIEKEG